MIHLVVNYGKPAIRSPRITSPRRVIDTAAIHAGWERWAVEHRRKLWDESKIAFAAYQVTGSKSDQLATVRAFNLFAVAAGGAE